MYSYFVHNWFSLSAPLALMAKVNPCCGQYLAQLVFGIRSSVVTIVNVPIWCLFVLFLPCNDDQLLRPHSAIWHLILRPRGAMLSFLTLVSFRMCLTYVIFCPL